MFCPEDLFDRNLLSTTLPVQDKPWQPRKDDNFIGLGSRSSIICPEPMNIPPGNQHIPSWWALFEDDFPSILFPTWDMLEGTRFWNSDSVCKFVICRLALRKKSPVPTSPRWGGGGWIFTTGGVLWWESGSWKVFEVKKKRWSWWTGCKCCRKTCGHEQGGP